MCAHVTLLTRLHPAVSLPSSCAPPIQHTEALWSSSAFAQTVNTRKPAAPPPHNSPQNNPPAPPPHTHSQQTTHLHHPAPVPHVPSAQPVGVQAQQGVNVVVQLRRLVVVGNVGLGARVRVCVCGSAAAADADADTDKAAQTQTQQVRHGSGRSQECACRYPIRAQSLEHAHHLSVTQLSEALCSLYPPFPQTPTHHLPSHTTTPLLTHPLPYTNNTPKHTPAGCPPRPC